MSFSSRYFLEVEKFSQYTPPLHLRRYDMNGRFQMQGGKNRFFPKEMNANRFFWDSHWLEIWSNHLCPSLGPNGGSVAMDSATQYQCPFTGKIKGPSTGESERRHCKNNPRRMREDGE
jgi:hypothetical protein